VEKRWAKQPYHSPSIKYFRLDCSEIHSKVKKKESLNKPLGRPANGSASSFSPLVKTLILQYRKDHPNWGAKSILNELTTHQDFLGGVLPSCSTITRCLKVSKLNKPYLPNRALTCDKVEKITQPHQLWQMDDQGSESYPSVGHVGMINIKDVFGKVYIQSFPVLFKHSRCHTSMKDYQCALRLAFLEFGLPLNIQADHGSIFYENSVKSPFPTLLHLWLLSLGIPIVQQNKPLSKEATKPF
jgi:hypothetical protein